jgi:HPt (histidine-containing phosphotransfer) domain-containing protein
MSDTYETKLAALRQRFRDRSAADSVVLARIVADLERGSPTAGLPPELRRIAHGLAGAAGTFGFEAISACAAELEDLVTEVADTRQVALACRALITEIRLDTTGPQFK